MWSFGCVMHGRVEAPTARSRFPVTSTAAIARLRKSARPDGSGYGVPGQ
jgi:hypothetical protein